MTQSPLSSRYYRMIYITIHPKWNLTDGNSSDTMTSIMEIRFLFGAYYYFASLKGNIVVIA